MNNISVSHNFRNRKNFIRYYFNVGANIRNTPQLIECEKCLFVSLVGEANSGKFLAALAIDMGMNPDRYPNGKISADTNIHGDEFLSPTNAASVCFHGSDQFVLRSQNSFDTHLSELAKLAPQSKIHIVSNLMRKGGEPIPNYENGFNSDLLDIAITVCKDRPLQTLREKGLDAYLEQEKAEGFVRNIIITARKRTTLSKIIQSIRP